MALSCGDHYLEHLSVRTSSNLKTSEVFHDKIRRKCKNKTEWSNELTLV